MRVASVPAGGPAERANFKITPMTRRTERPARTAGGGERRAAAGGRAEAGRGCTNLTFMKGNFWRGGGSGLNIAK
jgi:hypothetical protein